MLHDPELAVEKIVHAYEIMQAAPSLQSFPRALSILAHYSLGLDVAEFP